MASDLNIVVLVGRITRDCELSYLSSGTALCNFSIAVNRRVKKGAQWSDEASFFDLTLWDKQAENLNKYLVKGTQVAVQGELRQDRWERDGVKQSKVQVVVNDLQLLGGGKPGGQSQPQEQRPEPSKSAGSECDPNEYQDDIPFS